LQETLRENIPKTHLRVKVVGWAIDAVVNAFSAQGDDFCDPTLPDVFPQDCRKTKPGVGVKAFRASSTPTPNK
jgi:hypothetical protein